MGLHAASVRYRRTPGLERCSAGDCVDRIANNVVSYLSRRAGGASHGKVWSHFLPPVGDDVVLRLMARNADSIIALPREGGAEVLNSGQAIPWHSDVNVLDYARVMMGSEQYMLEQCDEEVAALERQEKIDETLFGSDNEWTQKAMKAVQNLKERYSGLGSVESAR